VRAQQAGSEIVWNPIESSRRDSNQQVLSACPANQCVGVIAIDIQGRAPSNELDDRLARPDPVLAPALV
jgi:hypothetical protein